MSVSKVPDVAQPKKGRRIEAMPIDKITEARRNPKRHADEAIAASVSRFGFVEPLVIDERTGRLVVGHGRLAELRRRHAAGDAPPEGVVVRRGRWCVPVVRGWASQDDRDAEGYVIASNRTTILGGWDDALLAEMLREANEAGDLLGTGYDAKDYDALLRGLPPEPLEGDLDAVPEPPATPTTQAGDLWLLGPHRLLCGDSTVAEDVLHLLDGEVADLVFTDPPYGVGYDGGAKPREGLVGDEIGTSIYADSLRHLPWAAAPHAALYLWYADAHAAAAAAAAAAAGYVVTAQIVWVKNHAQFVSSAHYHGKHEISFYAHRKGKTALWCGVNNEVTVWECNRSPRNDYHPTQKPVELAERALRNSSHPGDRVLDLFGGSGSTLIAAHAVGRVAYLMEIDPPYVDVICRRYQELTGNKPVLDRTGEPVSFVDGRP